MIAECARAVQLGGNNTLERGSVYQGRSGPLAETTEKLIKYNRWYLMEARISLKMPNPWLKNQDFTLKILS